MVTRKKGQKPREVREQRKEVAEVLNGEEHQLEPEKEKVAVGNQRQTLGDALGIPVTSQTIQQLAYDPFDNRRLLEEIELGYERNLLTRVLLAKQLTTPNTLL